MSKMKYEVFHLHDFELQSGEILPDAQLAYRTYGELDSEAGNTVLLPSFYTGDHVRNEGYFGAGRAIDPARHFVVSVNLFGNGLSSSPSNTPAPFDAARFPRITFYDNVRAQYRLLTERLNTLSAERAQLANKNMVVQSRVEAMITRLKGLEVS